MFGPNISGGIGDYGLSPDARSEGCIVVTQEGTYKFNPGTAIQKGFSLNASLASSLFGSSQTVQPLSVRLLPCIKL